jgi:putative PIN family toxin of toxin-antitoxin system
VLRAVVDANVYVSAYVRPEGPPGVIIERFLRDAAFEIVLSTEIVEEVLRALAYPKIRKAVRTKVEPALWFEDIVVLAQLVPGEYRVSGVSDDPDDDKYIAAAIEGRAAFVVSGDPDLLDVMEHQGVRIVTPRGFLDLLGV